MEIDELKTALLSQRHVVVKRPLLGEIFRAEITAVIYRRKNGKIDVSVETKDAYANSVAISDPSSVRYAAPEEIKEYYTKRKNIKHIKPDLVYMIDPNASVYKVIKSLSLLEMAQFFLKIMQNSKMPFCNNELCEEIDEYGICEKNKDLCFKAILNWLESEAVI